MRDLIGQDFESASPSGTRGISLAVYRVDAAGTRVLKPRRMFATEVDSESWPFTRVIPDNREPPCACSPDCRYLHRD